MRRMTGEACLVEGHSYYSHGSKSSSGIALVSVCGIICVQV